MLGVLPRGHDAASPSATPRWRDFTVDKPEVATWPLVGRGGAVSERLLTDVGLNILRWLTLLDRLGDPVPDREAAIARLEGAESQIKDKTDRESLRTGLRRLLHHHRQFPRTQRGALGFDRRLYRQGPLRSRPR